MGAVRRVGFGGEWRIHATCTLEVKLSTGSLILKERPPTLGRLWEVKTPSWSRSRWAEVLVVVKPETVVAWHRAGFRLFWKWRARVGRPKTTAEVRALISGLDEENPTLAAPKI